MDHMLSMAMRVIQQQHVRRPFSFGEKVFLNLVLDDAKIEARSLEVLEATDLATCMMVNFPPTSLQIAKVLLDNKPCPCLAHVDYEGAIEAVHHGLKTIHTSSCGIILMIVDYKILEKQLPTLDELREFSDNQAHMQRDPDDYFLKKKHALPTLNLDNMKPQQLEEDKMCSICQDNIEHKSQTAFKLPVCEHMFHSNAEDCLGEGNCLLTWLRKNKTCPECRKEVVIPDL
jgi:hypothetical protein